MTMITFGRACARSTWPRARRGSRPAGGRATPGPSLGSVSSIVGSFIGYLLDARSRPAGARRTVPPGVCAGPPAGGPAPGAPRTGPSVRCGLRAGRTAYPCRRVSRPASTCLARRAQLPRRCHHTRSPPPRQPGLGGRGRSARIPTSESAGKSGPHGLAAEPGGSCARHLGDDVPVDVGQPAVDAVVADGQPLVVDAQQVQDRGVQVVAVGLARRRPATTSRRSRRGRRRP